MKIGSLQLLHSFCPFREHPMISSLIYRRPDGPTPRYASVKRCQSRDMKVPRFGWSENAVMLECHGPSVRQHRRVAVCRSSSAAICCADLCWRLTVLVESCGRAKISSIWMGRRQNARRQNVPGPKCTSGKMWQHRYAPSPKYAGAEMGLHWNMLMPKPAGSRMPWVQNSSKMPVLENSIASYAQRLKYACPNCSGG